MRRLIVDDDEMSRNVQRCVDARRTLPGKGMRFFYGSQSGPAAALVDLIPLDVEMPLAVWS